MQRKSLPETDWTPKKILDAKVKDAQKKFACEFCGRRLRWLHIIEHVDYHRPATAGCCCAAHRCYDYDAAEAERECKNRAGRLMRFVDLRRWKPSRSNPDNVWRWVKLSGKKKLRVTVFPKWGRYSVSVADPNQKPYFHPEKYASQIEAMKSAFDQIESRKNQT